MKVGDLVKSSLGHLDLFGIVVRSGQHSALIHFNNGERCWASLDYLEVISANR